MTKKDLKEVEKALEILKSLKGNKVITDFKKTLITKIAENKNPEWTKAPKSYLRKLSENDVIKRSMKPTDIGFKKGYSGLFEKRTGMTLARHSDFGFLPKVGPKKK
jgi:predicted transcriptional regulator